MRDNQATLSKAKLSDLAKLKQKKYRSTAGQVILEGRRLMQQLAIYQVYPQEIYYSAWQEHWNAYTCPKYLLPEHQLQRLCDTDTAPQVAALYPLPQPRIQDFQSALYLDGISDPGNLGTIFRLAAAFELKQILLSPNCCEIYSPKVIRASMGAVYHIAFMVQDYASLSAIPATKIALKMEGATPLKDFTPPPKAAIYILGSEAHGISEELLASADIGLKIEMAAGMESLNVAIACGILGHHLYTY